jgi:hypothetical protein
MTKQKIDKFLKRIKAGPTISSFDYDNKFKIKQFRFAKFANINEQLDLLLFKIDIALIENNQTDFLKYSKEYKYLKSEA